MTPTQLASCPIHACVVPFKTPASNNSSSFCSNNRMNAILRKRAACSDSPSPVRLGGCCIFCVTRKLITKISKLTAHGAQKPGSTRLASGRPKECRKPCLQSHSRPPLGNPYHPTLKSLKRSSLGLKIGDGQETLMCIKGGRDALSKLLKKALMSNRPNHPNRPGS